MALEVSAPDSDRLEVPALPPTRTAGPQRRRIVFVTWDGPQVSYLDGLFVPIFRGLRPYGIEFSVLQFTWAGREQVEAQRLACVAAGIDYRAVRIWRRPGGIGPLGSVWWGTRALREVVATFGATAIMPRSLMPAMAVLRGGHWPEQRLIFDADGLMADERVDFAGLNPSGLTYRLLRDVEAEMVRRAEVTLVRTVAAADIMRHRAGPQTERRVVLTVSNGRDPAVFAPLTSEARIAARLEQALPLDAPVLV